LVVVALEIPEIPEIREAVGAGQVAEVAAVSKNGILLVVTTAHVIVFLVQAEVMEETIL
jgi:hypothetical protein